MRAYRSATGELFASQASAGKGAEPIDIPPTIKGGLLDFINQELGRARSAPAPSRDQQLDEGYQLDGLKAPAASDASRCSLCGRDHDKAERGAARLAAGMDADAIAQRILDADDFPLTKLVGAVVERFSRMQRAAGDLGGTAK